MGFFNPKNLYLQRLPKWFCITARRKTLLQDSCGHSQGCWILTTKRTTLAHLWAHGGGYPVGKDTQLLASSASCLVSCNSLSLHKYLNPKEPWSAFLEFQDDNTFQEPTELSLGVQFPVQHWEWFIQVYGKGQKETQIKDLVKENCNQK